jgi:alanine dehydrogenase
VILSEAILGKWLGRGPRKRSIMKTLVLSNSDVLSLCDYNDLRIAMRNALRSFSSGAAKSFPRHVLPMANGLLGLMGAEDLSSRLTGLKVVSVYPSNVTSGLNPHQGLVILFNPETGQVRGLVEGSSLTALRTAAVSAAAADVLAKKDASHLALIGAGLQALEHARAFNKIRKISKITIQSRSPERARHLSKTLAGEINAEFEISSSPREAVKNADLVVTATPAKEPLISTLDLREGAYLSAVGSCRPGFREVAFISRPGLKIFMDSKQACEQEAEELLHALKIKQVAEHEISGEIGQCFQNKIKGREHEDEVTVFKSVGLGIEDLAAAEFFLASAERRGVGQEVDL